MAVQLAGLPYLAVLFGFLTSFMSSIFADRRWALAAPAISLAGYALFALIPAGGLYVVGALMAVLGVIAAPYGGGRVGAFAALGWAFLVLTYPNDVGGVTLIVFALAGGWGVAVAGFVGLAGLSRARPVEAVRAPVVLSAVLALGFVLTLWLAQTLPLARPYWVPLIFLQVLGTSGLDTAQVSWRRMNGALVGALIALAVLAADPPPGVELALASIAFVIALRITLAYPLASRAFTTAAILWALAGVDQEGAQTRILAEVVAVGVLLIVAGTLSIIQLRLDASET